MGTMVTSKTPPAPPPCLGGRQGGNGAAHGGREGARGGGDAVPPDLYGNLNRIRQAANCTPAY